MDNKKNKNQKGGKFIGRGSFGCVYYPNLPCSTSSYKYESDMNHISKVTSVDQLDEEWKSISDFKLDILDPESKYFIYPKTSCEITDRTISSDTDFFKCGIYKKQSKKTIKENYVNIIQSYGGPVSYKRKTDLNFEENWYLYLNLLIGLGILHKNRIYHKDIKEDNIVYSPVSGFRFIDFGLTSSYDSLPIVDIKEINKSLKFHRLHRDEALSAISPLQADITKLEKEINSNSSKSKLFRLSVETIRKKIKTLTDLRLILEGMQSKLSYHNQQLDTFIEHKYNDWIDMRQSYLYWPKDFYILDKFINEKDTLSFYDSEHQIRELKFEQFLEKEIENFKKTYDPGEFYLTTEFDDYMIDTYLHFLNNVFKHNKYASPEKFSEISHKIVTTLDIFSIGIFLATDYKFCSDRKKINTDFRTQFKILISEMVSLNPETRPTIDVVITKFMKIVKDNLIDSGFLTNQTIKFDKIVNELKKKNLISEAQLKHIT